MTYFKENVLNYHTNKIELIITKWKVQIKRNFIFVIYHFYTYYYILYFIFHIFFIFEWHSCFKQYKYDINKYSVYSKSKLVISSNGTMLGFSPGSSLSHCLSDQNVMWASLTSKVVLPAKAKLTVMWSIPRRHAAGPSYPLSHLLTCQNGMRNSMS